jgi:hypothetical protein
VLGLATDDDHAPHRRVKKAGPLGQQALLLGGAVGFRVGQRLIFGALAVGMRRGRGRNGAGLGLLTPRLELTLGLDARGAVVGHEDHEDGALLVANDAGDAL